ncbi:lactonase family protein [Rathayibacter soli]|uniref:lactonase family protein n=1 Tax=Rathayibacter soli TaxID=3144168 RepID=UPI0027E3E22A|nr:beta-propeller fold lactonase family protein [Glaciibacter superstes]
MKIATRLCVAAIATASLIGAGATAANADTVAADAPNARPVGTVLVQTDGLTGNAIVSYDRLPDGTLRQAGTYPTGGLGVALGGSVVDHLASQSSLAADGNAVFAVNGGSNTITSFLQFGDRLIQRQVIGSNGEAPVSIAAHGARVFVLNARGGGSIQGFLNLGGHLISVPAWHRALGLNPNATPEFTSTPAQIAFTPDGSKLVIATKGGTSSFDVFTMNLLGPSQLPVVTSLPGAVPFGFQFDAAGRLVTSEAGTNSVASFTVNSDGSLTKISEQATGQKATCWLVIDGQFVYASNAGSGTLSGYQLGQDGALTALGTTPTDAGTVDAAVSRDGQYLYVQTGAAGNVDEFRVAPNGSLQSIGTVTVPGAVGGEGIVAN